MKALNVRTLASIASIIGCLFVSTNVDAANGYFDCPLSPTEFQVSIPNPDPGSGPGEFPADLDEILGYVLQNNISSVKELLDHTPDHMRKNYAFVAETKGLGQTNIDQPGLLLFGSDGRFMMNMDTIPTAPRYEVVDIAYLNEAGDWEFKSLDFRTSPPVLSLDGGNNNECRECHGNGGVNGNGPMRPFWGNYLDWPGFFSDNGQNQEQVTPEQASTLTRIQDSTQNPDRFHSIITESNLFDIGRFMNLPDRQYGISLTVANNEIGSAAAESIFKRAKRSPLYNQLREEYLTLAYCARAGEVSSEDRTNLTNQIESLGGSTAAISANIYRGWMDIVQLWGLDPLHEFPLHQLTKDFATTTLNDARWNASSGDLDEQLTLLVLLDLAEQNPQVDGILRNHQSSYQMTNCGYLFNNMKEYLQHKVYANFTLKGNARQLARSSYYDIDYTRFTQTMENVKTELCDLLTSEIGADTSQPTESVDDPVATIPNDPVNQIVDACQQGQTPVGNIHLTAGNAVCLQDVSNGDQRQMALFVPDDKVGSTLEIILSHGSGNGNLLHRHDSRPTSTIFDHNSSDPENEERILVQNVQRSWNYIHVRADTAFSGVTLRARFIQQ